ncbi:MAG: hypothetical protein WDO74_18455 [Pseudomonadota bacterium]
MNEAPALLLLSIALTACTGSSARQPAAQASAFAQPANRAASRLGPPSPRGLGLRRVDRPTAAEPPLALY